MRIRSRAFAGVMSLAIVGPASAMGVFGGPDDVDYASKLWNAMDKAGLLGEDGVMSTPYTGVHPHGAILDTIESKLSVDGERNILIVKRNYGGEGVSKQAVAKDPAKWLQAVTVMYKRAGYDNENKDWFWVKYSASGDVLKNPKGVSLAGRVGKGGNAGCVACHKAAPGGDLVFNHDRY
jgi:hypothetical protein